MLLMGIVFLVIFVIGYGMGDSDYFAFLFIGIPFFGFGLASEIILCCGISEYHLDSVLDLVPEINAAMQRQGVGMSRTKLDETDAKSKSDANIHIHHIGTTSSSLEIDISSSNL